jgi:hypothetical protein
VGPENLSLEIDITSKRNTVKNKIIIDHLYEEKKINKCNF